MEKTKSWVRYVFAALVLLNIVMLLISVPTYLDLLKGGGTGQYIRTGLSFIGNIGIYVSIGYIVYTSFVNKLSRESIYSGVKYLLFSIFLYVLPEQFFLSYGKEIEISCNADSMSRVLLVIAILLAYFMREIRNKTGQAQG